MFSQFVTGSISKLTKSRDCLESAKSSSRISKEVIKINPLLQKCPDQFIQLHKLLADVISAANPKCKPSMYMVCGYEGALIITNAR